MNDKSSDILNILVLGVGGNVSQGIVKAIRRSMFKVNVIGACVTDNNPGKYFVDEFILSPLASDETFISWVTKTCEHYKIDMIFSGVEEVVFELSQGLDEIEERSGARFVTPGNIALQVGMDKLSTCMWLEKNKCNFPIYVKSNTKSQLNWLVSKCGFPLIAKPRKGKGSLGISIITCYDDLYSYIGDESYIIQELVGREEEEYTVGCYICKNGDIELIVFKRRLISGKTVEVEVINSKEIDEECRKICELLGAKGSINIQMRIRNSNTPVCFEINSRLSGTTSMRSMFGFKDVEALISEYVVNDDSLKDLNLFNIKRGKAFRYDEEVYDFD